MTLGRTSLIHFLTQVVKSIAGFLTTFTIARLLGADAIGTFAMATSLVVILSLPAKTVSGSMNKRVSEAQEPSAYFTAGILIILIFSAVVSLFLFAGRAYVTEYLDVSLIGLILLLFASTSAYDIYTAVLTGEKKVVASGIVGSVEQICRFLFQVSLIVVGFQLVGLFVGNILSLVVSAVVGIYISDLRLVQPRERHFRRLYDYAKFTWVSHLKGRSFSWIDVLLLGVLVDSTLVGIYQVSWTMASALILVSQSIQQTLFPEVSQLGMADDYDRVHHLLREGLSFVGVFAIPGLFGAWIIGGELLTIYRPIFSQGYRILLLLIIARIIDSYARQFLSVLAAIDYPELQFRADIIFVVVNAILNLVLIWLFGWIGASVATALSAGLELVLGYYYITKTIGRPDIPYDQILRQVAAGVVMAGMTWGLTRVIAVNNYSAAALVFVGATIYLSALVAMSSLVRKKLLLLAPYVSS